MMFIKYLDRFGNWNEFDETQQPGWRSRFTQRESGVRYENSDSPKPVIVKKAKPIKEPIVDTVEEVVEEAIEEDYTVYRNFLKEKKIK